MTRPQLLLACAARLLGLAAISRARRSSKTSDYPSPQGIPTMTTADAPIPDDVKALTAELLDRLSLNADGEHFDEGDPDAWESADAAEPEIVRLGFAKFRIVDPDATDLAHAAGAIDEHSPPTLCLRVRFENIEGEPQRRAGQYVALDTEAGVSLLFVLWCSGDDVHAPAPQGFDLGPDAQRNGALDVLQPAEALLVQVFDEAEDE